MLLKIALLLFVAFLVWLVFWRRRRMALFGLWTSVVHPKRPDRKALPPAQ